MKARAYNRISDADRAAIVALYKDGVRAKDLTAKFPHIPVGSIGTVLYRARQEGLVSRGRAAIGASAEGRVRLATIACARAARVQWRHIGGAVGVKPVALINYCRNNDHIYRKMLEHMGAPA